MFWKELFKALKSYHLLWCCLAELQESCWVVDVQGDNIKIHSPALRQKGARNTIWLPCMVDLAAAPIQRGLAHSQGFSWTFVISVFYPFWLSSLFLLTQHSSPAYLVRMGKFYIMWEEGNMYHSLGIPEHNGNHGVRTVFVYSFNTHTLVTRYLWL